MTKQEQIEEIARLMCMNTSNSGDCEKCGFKRRLEFGFMHQCFKYDDAEKIYNAGYRKGETISYQAMIDSSYIYQINQLEESLYKIRTETAKEIFQGLESMANNGVYQGKLTVQQMRIFFKEHYAVEVEE